MNNSILNYIGNTPLIELKQIKTNPNVRLMAKLEYVNPGGSIKDRPALYMIESGERSKALTHDKIIIEATSGNTGIGLALICGCKHYRLLLAMSESASIERRKILLARGADILLTPGHLGTDGAIEEVYRIVRDHPDTYFMTDQFNNDANWQSHFETTGPEIWQQTNGQIDCFIATMGTTGTLMGITRFLKKQNPAIQCIGVEPYLGHKIQGLKNMKESYTPEIYNKTEVYQIINIEDEEAFDMSRKLAKEEGLFVGMSSGAAMVIGLKIAQKMTHGTIVMIFPDSGERYLTTSLFDVPKQGAAICFHNTMGNQSERFESRLPGKVDMYCCGPTVYHRITMADCRRFVFYDVLKRYLEFRGYQVNQLMNVTDMDDKTLKAADAEHMSIEELTDKYYTMFLNDIKLLEISPPSKLSKASDNIDEMIQLAEQLTLKGYAYEKLRSLYFNISKFREYGSYSGLNLDKIISGQREDRDHYEKDNPRDFTLFKRCRLSELKKGLYYATKWGNVRPGWHIECAAMALTYFGDQFDIYAGSSNLIFPHQENMIAMMKAVTGKMPSKFWLNCEGLVFHSNNNTQSTKKDMGLQDLLDLGLTGKEIRFFLLSKHYRKSLKVSLNTIKNSCAALKRINNWIYSLCMHDLTNESYPNTQSWIKDVQSQFIDHMDNDLNVSGVFSMIFAKIRDINRQLSQQTIHKQDTAQILDCIKTIDSVFNVFTFPTPLEQEIISLLNERNKLRKEKKYHEADLIRQQLIQKGVTIHDQKH